MLNESAACAEASKEEATRPPEECFVELSEAPAQEEVLTEWTETAADVGMTDENVGGCAVMVEIEPPVIVIDDD